MKVLILLSNLISELKVSLSRLPFSKSLDLPFYSQDPESERKYKYRRKLSEQEFRKWVDSACGMFCLKMILKKKFDKEYSVIDLAEDAMSFGVYDILPDGKLSAMKYLPFQKFIKTRFNFKSEVCRILSLKRIKYEISKGNFVITSVHWDIKKAPSSKFQIPNIRKGGHLVVVIGYSEPEESFYINNPSGIKGVSDRNYRISYAEFKKFFANRGIVVMM